MGNILPTLPACPSECSDTTDTVGPLLLNVGVDHAPCDSSKCFTCVTDEGTVSERSWKTYGQNFDNTVQALVVLFEISTLEAWPSIALNAVDSTGTDSWPVQDHNRYMILFFCLFVFEIFLGDNSKSFGCPRSHPWVPWSPTLATLSNGPPNTITNTVAYNTPPPQKSSDSNLLWSAFIA